MHTKSAARNIFYGGSAFFLLIFFGLTWHSHTYIVNISTNAKTLTPAVANGKKLWEDNRLAGAINTMILITSGFCAALAVHYQRANKTALVRTWLSFAAILGIVFLGVKWVEYSEKITAGISTETNSFFMFYYLTTGFHALHVVFGIVVLAIVGWKNSLENVLTGTAFWHMVDLIWVILFPLIYLMR